MATINTSTIATTTLVHFPQYYLRFQIIQDVLAKISFPYLFSIAFLGLITNTSTIILLSKNNITKSLKTKWILIALALSDLLFNIALLIRVIHDIVKRRSDRLCLILSFVSHLAELLSACYTVAFTIQRYIVVRYPFEATLHRRSSPIISLLIIFILSSIYCFLSSYKNEYADCHEDLTLGWSIADALLSFIIPLILISIFNILIINCIHKHSVSPVSVQSTLLRKKKLPTNSYKICNRDDTSETENNPIANTFATFIHLDGNQNIEVKCLREEKQLSIEMNNRTYRPTISSSSDRRNSETSSNHHQSHSLILSKANSSNKNQLSGKSSCQSNDDEFVGNISKIKFQSIRVSRMLVLVSTCFLILNAPAHLSLIAVKTYLYINSHTISDYDQQTKHFIFNNETSNQINNDTISTSVQHGAILDDGITIHLLYMAVTLTQLIAYSSYSINFFLYSFSGIHFRASLTKLINKFRRH